MITRNPNKARCYRVSSSKGGDPYDVELDALDGNGRCDCANFIFRMEDKVQRGSWGLMCKHIIAARKFDLLTGNSGQRTVSRGQGVVDSERPGRRGGPRCTSGSR